MQPDCLAPRQPRQSDEGAACDDWSCQTRVYICLTALCDASRVSMPATQRSRVITAWPLAPCRSAIHRRSLEARCPDALHCWQGAQAGGCNAPEGRHCALGEMSDEEGLAMPVGGLRITAGLGDQPKQFAGISTGLAALCSQEDDKRHAGASYWVSYGPVEATVTHWGSGMLLAAQSGAVHHSGGKHCWLAFVHSTSRQAWSSKQASTFPMSTSCIRAACQDTKIEPD